MVECLGEGGARQRAREKERERAREREAFKGCGFQLLVGEDSKSSVAEDPSAQTCLR